MYLLENIDSSKTESSLSAEGQRRRAGLPVTELSAERLPVYMFMNFFTKVVCLMALFSHLGVGTMSPPPPLRSARSHGCLKISAEMSLWYGCVCGQGTFRE